MNDYTAVVLSATDYTRRWPGVDVIVSKQEVTNAAEIHAARLDAIARVETPYFFYLDDDDELPADYLDVLSECRSGCSPIAYTDEEIVNEDGSRQVAVSGEYTRLAHLDRPMMLHHLVLCETGAAKAASARLPRGHYWTEFLLYWELARGGANYVPRVGYIWNKREDRMNTKSWATISQVRSLLHYRDEARAVRAAS